MLRAFLFYKLMNYRKYYEEQTGKKVPTDWYVHHIGRDRDNNDLINLVALPAKLHQLLHEALRTLPSVYVTEDFQDVSFIQCWNQLEKFMPVFYAMNRCVDYRNHMYHKKTGDILAFTGFLWITGEYEYSDIENIIEEEIGDYLL